MLGGPQKCSLLPKGLKKRKNCDEDGKIAFSAEQMNYLISNLPNFKRKKVTEKKRKVTLESDDSVSDDVETSNVIQQMSKHS